MNWGENAVVRLRQRKDSNEISVFSMDTEAVFRTAFYFKSKSSELWYNLAMKLPPAATMVVDGVQYDVVACLKRAVELDDQNLFAWVLLGVTLKETSTQFSGKRRFRNSEGCCDEPSSCACVEWDHCFEKAIIICEYQKHMPQAAVVWANIAAVMEPTDQVAGRNRLAAALEAVKCDRTNPTTIFNLACLLKSDKQCQGAVEEMGWLDTFRDSKNDAMSSDDAEKSLLRNWDSEKSVDLFQYMLDTKMDLKSVKMRLLLGLMYPDHPHIQEYGSRFKVDLEEVIGRGFESTVYAGTEIIDDHTERELAVKKVSYEFTDMDVKAAKVLRDMAELSVLLHEKFSTVIVPCVHVYFSRAESSAYIFMRRASGTLEKVIRGEMQLGTKPYEGFNTTDILEVAHELITAVRMLHHYNFVHGDIKPDNILVFKDGSIRLTDFGFSRSISTTAVQKRSLPAEHDPPTGFSSDVRGIGTTGYQAPEVLGGLTEYPTQATDVFAIGCTLFKLATGFDAESLIDDPEDEEWEFCTNNGLREANVHASVVDIISECTSAAPTERKSCAELLALPAFNGVATAKLKMAHDSASLIVH